MRRAAGLLFALAIMIPVGVVAATPAYAGVPTCAKFAGTQIYSPALPKLGSKTKVHSTSTVSATLSKCTGGGKVTSGTILSHTPYIGNCTTFLAGSKQGVPGKPSTSTIKWNSGKPSTVTSTLTQTSKPLATPIIVVLKSLIKSGQFAGLKTTVTLIATPNAGACLTKPLSKIAFANKGPFKKG